MACQWRIRHKLVLGLGLVVGIMGLLLAGTLKGLLSYSSTTKSVDSKLAELNKAEAFRQVVAEFANRPDFRMGTDDGLAWLQDKIDAAEASLTAYVDRLRDTVTRRRDPDKGFMETDLTGELHLTLRRLKVAAAKAYDLPRMMANDRLGAFLDDPVVVEEIQTLVRQADDLRDAINDDLDLRTQEAKKNYRDTMWIVLTTNGLCVLLLASLTRFLYRWIFYPVRDLQLGAGRVAQGEFEHRIEVHSGDEMEELAAAFNNMTDRLREMYRDLAHQVNERSRQLVRSERLASVGFLAAGVAHEINNPLASIAFCSEALESRLADKLVPLAGDGEIISKYLRMIQQEAFRCKAITQRLLEFSRGGERRREPTNLADLIQSVLDMVQHLQNCKGKQIFFEPTNPLVAWVNAQEIKSVVLNLVVNALDSMDDGGKLTITLHQEDQKAQITFRDTGCGMTSEILENIFEPFFTRSRTGKGTGLGLSISHRIISQHGGEIEATSPGPHQGSTFRVRLPLQPAEPSKEESLGHAAA